MTRQSHPTEAPRVALQADLRPRVGILLARLREIFRMRDVPYMARQAPLMEAYEARLLYSADLAPAGLGLEAGFQVVEQRSVDNLGEFISEPVQAEQVRRSELLIVGAGIDDLDTVLGRLKEQGREIEVLMLEPGMDSIEQITAVLDGRQELDAIHILSHGSSGRLDLGGAILSTEQLRTRGDEIAAWGNALSSDGDILLYGCDVAADAAGQSFVTLFSSLTGADVAASSNLTGNAALGGDWNLEYASGGIESTLAVSAVAQSQWMGTLASQANSTLSDPQKDASVAIAANGNSVVVWTSGGSQDGKGEGVFGRLFDAQGNPVGSQFQINTDFDDDQKEAVVGMDASGNFVVAWTSKHGTPADNSGTSIHAQRFNADGTKAGAEFVVNQVAARNQELASIAVAADGQFVVAWGADTNGRDVYARHFDARGNALSDDILVNNDRLDGNQEFASVAIHSDGSYIVAWQSDKGGSGRSIFAQRFSATDARLGTNFMVNTFDGNDQTLPSVAIGGTGDFVIAWTSVGQDGDKHGVYAQRYLANGDRAGSEILVNDVTRDEQAAPSVSMAADGSFVVAWTGEKHPSGDKKDVFVKRFNPDGTASAGESRLNAHIAEDQKNVKVAMNARGDYVVAWEGASATDKDGVMMANFVAANVAPTALADSVSTDQNTPAGSGAPGLLANDSNPDSGTALSIVEAKAGGALDAIAVSAEGITIVGVYGSLFLRPDGSYTYTPNATTARALAAGQSAVDVFEYTVRDENNATASSTLTVTVNGLNDAPLAADDTYAVGKTSTLNISAGGVLSNDADPDRSPADTLFVAAVNDKSASVGTVVTGTYGRLVVNADGSLSYNPDTLNILVSSLLLGNSLTDSFTYTVSDGTQTSTATIQIVLQGGNDAPVANDDSGYTVAEDGTLTVGSGAGVLQNDTDPDNTALSAALVSGPAHGTLVFNADGSFVYTPDALYSGTDSFSYRASDGSLSDLATVTITVTHVNHAPVSSDDAAGVNQDGSLTVPTAGGVLGNDSDVDVQDALAVAQIQSGSTTAVVSSGTVGVITTQYGTLTMHADGSYSYVADGAASKTLAADATTSDTFTYTVSDGAGGSELGTLVITITGSNDMPVITGTLGSQATDDKSSLSPFAGVTIADIDSPDQALTVTITLNSAAKGSLSNLGGGSYNAATGVYTVSGTATEVTAAVRSLVFTPTANRAAPGTTETTPFKIAVSDGLGVVQDQVTSVVTTSVNDAPQASNDAGAVNQDATLTVPAANGVLGNDTDVDALTHLSVGQVQSGSTAVTVNSGNPGVIVTQYGTLTLHADGSYSYVADGAASKALAAGATATDSFTYRVEDGAGGQASAELAITITGANDTPVIAGTVTAQPTNDQSTLSPFAGVSFDDADNPAQTLTVTIALDSTAKGSISNLGIGSYNALTGVYTVIGSAAEVTAAVRSLVFTPAANRVAPGATETTLFTITVDDGAASTQDTGTTVVSTSVNDAPVANDDSGYTVAEDGTLTVGSGAGVLQNDTDPDNTALSAALVSGPSHGTLVFNADGSFVYTPDALYSGTDSFSYRASDGSLSDLATVTITVTHVNHAPVSSDDAAGVNQDGSLTVPTAGGVLGNDSDVDVQDALAVAQIQSGSATAVVSSGTVGVITTQYGTLTMHADGSYSYVADGAASKTLAQGMTAVDSFTYILDDGVGGSSTARLTVTITGSNDTPVITGTVESQQTNDKSALPPFSNVSFNDVDGPSQTLTVTIALDSPVKGRLSNLGIGSYDAAAGIYTVSGTAAEVTAAVRSLVFTPGPNRLAPGTTETTAFAITASDGLGSVQDLSSSVVSMSVNDAPQVLAVAASDLQGTGQALALTLLGTDPDNAVASFRLDQLPANGQLFLDADGKIAVQLNTPIAAAVNQLTVYFKPNSGWSGTTMFTYRATDAAGLDSADTALVSITVSTLPAAPEPVENPPAESPTTPPAAPPTEAPPELPSEQEAPVPEAAPGGAKVPEAAPPADSGTPEQVKESAPAQAPAMFLEPGEQSAQVLEPQVQPENVEQQANERQQPRSATRIAAGSFTPVSVNLDAFSLEALSIGDAGTLAGIENGEAEGPRSTLQASTMTHKLDSMRENLKESEEVHQKIIGSSVVAGTSMSVGYVIWLLRGGVLATSLMSSLPAWRFIDPLPVLARNGQAEDEPADESLETMVQHGGQDRSATAVRDAGAPDERKMQ